MRLAPGSRPSCEIALQQRCSAQACQTGADLARVGDLPKASWLHEERSSRRVSTASPSSPGAARSRELDQELTNLAVSAGKLRAAASFVAGVSRALRHPCDRYLSFAACPLQPNGSSSAREPLRSLADSGERAHPRTGAAHRWARHPNHLTNIRTRIKAALRVRPASLGVPAVARPRRVRGGRVRYCHGVHQSAYAGMTCSQRGQNRIAIETTSGRFTAALGERALSPSRGWFDAALWSPRARRPQKPNCVERQTFCARVVRADDRRALGPRDLVCWYSCSPSGLGFSRRTRSRA